MSNCNRVIMCTRFTLNWHYYIDFLEHLLLQNGKYPIWEMNEMKLREGCKSLSTNTFEELWFTCKALMKPTFFDTERKRNLLCKCICIFWKIFFFFFNRYAHNASVSSVCFSETEVIKFTIMPNADESIAFLYEVVTK